MFDFYDLVLFSFLLVPIGKDLALTPVQETTLLGVALGGSGIGGIIFGYLSDRFGRRQVMTWTILVYSMGTGLTAFSRGFWTILGFRLLTGLGVGGEWAVGHALLAESTPQRMRGRASALLQAGEPMGVGLAAIMGFLVAPVIGWRAVFFVSAGSALVAFVVRTHLPESHLWERQREDRLSPAQALALIARYRLTGVTLKGFVLAVLKLGTYWTCYTWLPKFLQTEIHQSIGRSALWMLTAQFGQFTGMLIFGYLADRFGRRVLFTRLLAGDGVRRSIRWRSTGTRCCRTRCSSGARSSASASGRAARPGSARCWRSCSRPTSATSRWARCTTPPAACSSSRRSWSATSWPDSAWPAGSACRWCWRSRRRAGSGRCPRRGSRNLAEIAK